MSESSDKQSEHSVRDRLALERTRLANERTLLAYGRTAIMLAATGATLLQLYGDRSLYATAGWTLIACGVAVAARGAARCRKLARLIG